MRPGPSWGRGAARQAVFYTIYFAGIGASMPFMPLWFKAHGLSPNQIGLILAGPYIARAIIGPLIGVWSDRFGDFRTPIIWLSLVATGLFGAMSLYGQGQFWPLLILWCVGYSVLTCVNPLVDAMTFQLARREGFPFSRPRAAGSAAFVASNLGIGWLLTRAAPDVVLAFVAAAGLGCAVAGRWVLAPVVKTLPALRAAAGPSAAKGGLIGLLANRRFMLLLLCLGLLQASHSYYYSFSTLLWEADGISSATAGGLWATGVLAEVLYLYGSEPLRRRMGPWTMLQIAAAAGVLRWAAMMLPLPLWLVFGLQLTHALSFAALFVAGVELVQTLAPKGSEGSAQVLYAALGPGLMVGLGVLASGAIHDAWGADGYGAMAMLSLAGLLLAHGHGRLFRPVSA